MFDLSFLVISGFLVLTSLFFSFFLFKRINDDSQSRHEELKELKKTVQNLEKEVEVRLRYVEAKISDYDSFIALIQKMMRDM
jgi:peptidoglycan hydrolase CwlO-like protein